jgi:hypothetical protein
LTSRLLDLLFPPRQVPNGQDFHQNVRLPDE